MNSYRHSVVLDEEKCTGCTTCIRRCPTEAIRILNGKANIDTERCIDCGECIRVCPHKAKKAKCSRFEHYMHYKWKVALPAPALFGQFNGLEDVDEVLEGLKRIGFDDIFEVAKAAEMVTAYTRTYLKTDHIKKPVISSACPVIGRLIALRFPYLKDNLLPIMPPMEIAAVEARKKAQREHPELKPEEIGIFFLSPCAAKVSYVRNGYGGFKSNVDVVISLSDIYFLLISAMKRGNVPTVNSESGMIGIGWASSGGEATALLNDSYLSADGIENCIQVLESIENGNIPQLEFVELNACIGGCVGGVMTIENPFIAKTRLQTVRRYLPVSRNFLSGDDAYVPPEYTVDGLPEYKPITRLSDSMGQSMRMMAQIQQIKQTLPGIDCGACGSPTCRAFAEDVVRGLASDGRCCVVLEQRKEETEGPSHDGT
ncbi:MAG: 4Fe-4S binding protein [Clostridia bacterium]|nr:4Fe-4S binding protein [Clostridia bacterium]MBQ9507411.1 4Fe-4S binding protein [Clostridia bacterium]MBR5422798.1 4Fe-4S binding protein [Clostridia bacterium]